MSVRRFVKIKKYMKNDIRNACTGALTIPTHLKCRVPNFLVLLMTVICQQNSHFTSHVQNCHVSWFN